MWVRYNFNKDLFHGRITRFLCVALFFLILSCPLDSRAKGHDFTKQECSLCHRLSEEKIVGNKEKYTYQCGVCHRQVIESICHHKVDIPFTAKKNAMVLPLSSSGEITCNTCHDVHALPLTKEGVKTHYLQLSMCVTDLCLVCHEGSTLEHSGLLKTAHLAPVSSEKRVSQEVDPLSLLCLSCHSGVTASSRLPGELSLPGGCYSAGLSLNHPVGVDYLEARDSRGKKNLLLPIEEVNKKILFWGNTMSCGSCHDPYSREEKKLRVSNIRSGLCLSCHKM